MIFPISTITNLYPMTTKTIKECCELIEVGNRLLVNTTHGSGLRDELSAALVRFTNTVLERQLQDTEHDDRDETE